MSTDTLRASEWTVGHCQHRQAVEFIEEQHYAGGAPNTSVARHALFHADDPMTVHGVALWLPPTRRAAASVCPDAPRGVLALSRLCVARHVPTNGASFLLGRSMRLLDRRLWHTLLTYADTRQGHTGAIYRATNWSYLGVVPGSDAWVDANGVQRGRKRGGRNIPADEMRRLGAQVRAPHEGIRACSVGIGGGRMSVNERPESAESVPGCRVIWTTDEKPTRRCVTHEYDWRPPYEPMCPGSVTAPGTTAGGEGK